MIKIEENNGRITVRFPYNLGHIIKIKTIKGYKWHPEERCWSVPYFELETLLSAFDDEKVEIDPSVLFVELRKELIARKYSRRTIKLYLHYNEGLLKFSRKIPHKISNEDVRNYLFYLAEQKNASASTLNIAINALKFYYGAILKRNFIYEIKRPTRDKKFACHSKQGGSS